MRKALYALLIWTSFLVLATGLFVVMSAPQPLEAQTGIVRFSTISAGSFYRAVPRTAISVTANSYITPTGTYQRLNSAGNVATSGAKLAVMPAGTIQFLVNVGSYTITLTETGTLISAGNIVLGPNDVKQFLSDGTNYRQAGGSDN